MNKSQQLEVENRLFFRAAWLRATVDGLHGYLVCDTDDAQLAALVALYNTFFAEPFAQDGAAWDVFWDNFQTCRPLAGGVKNGWILPAPTLKQKP